MSLTMDRPLIGQSVGEGLVDRRVYTDERLYEVERERVFARSWQFVCHEGEIPEPGDYLTTEIAGESIVVWRDLQSRVRAFYNSCSHRGAEVAPEARGHCSKFFKCMYHGWTYDLDGRCVAIPYPTAYGEQCRKEDQGLTEVPFEVFVGLVFVALEPRVASLLDFLGESAPYIEQLCSGREVVGRVQFAFEGNWKLWHDNFADNYHPEFSHRLVRDLSAGFADQGSNEDLDFGHGLLRWPTPQADLERYAKGIKQESGWDIDLLANPAWAWVPYAETRPGAEDMVLGVFPNLSVESFYDGRSILMQVVCPNGVGESVVHTALFGDVGESTEERQRRLWTAGSQVGSWGKVAADDTEAMARVQRGLGRSRPFVNMRRGQAPGKIGETRDEYSLRAFHTAWRAYMADGDKGGLDGQSDG